MKRGEVNLEVINHLQQIESTNYTVCNYIQCVDTEDRCPLESRRVEICSWMYRFADSCNLCRDLVSRAMSYFDRFLMSMIKSNEYNDSIHRIRITESLFLQLSALVALNLAFKIHSTHEWNLKHMIKLSHGTFELTELIDMERKMLNALAWRLNPPTSAEFVTHFASLLLNMTSNYELANYFDDIVEMAIFLSELALWDSYFLDHKVSLLALASLLNAIELFCSTQKVISISSLTSFRLILESSGLIPRGETLCHIRSRVYEVFSRSECSQEFKCGMLEQPEASQRISQTTFSQVRHQK